MSNLYFGVYENDKILYNKSFDAIECSLCTIYWTIFYFMQ